MVSTNNQKSGSFGFRLIILLISFTLISCSNSSDDPIQKFDINIAINGLIGSITILNNNADPQTLNSATSFKYSNIADGFSYNITIATQPQGQTCSIKNGSGDVDGTDINNVTITCSNNNYSVSGSISGLLESVILQNNAGDDLTLNSDGSFTFLTTLVHGSNYAVTNLTQPVGQTCTVSNGDGQIDAANINNISVNCVNNTYNVGGSITGLQDSLTLQNNEGDDLNLNSSGSFTFDTEITRGSSYLVTILSQPIGQTCMVSNGSGTIDIADINNISVNCIDNNYSIGGSISGLLGTLTLQNNGSDDIIRNTSGTFTFPTFLTHNSSYLITVETQPAGQTCSITNENGMINASNVDNISVECTSIQNRNIGGEVSGLTGTLEIQNNVNDTLLINSNGSYVFDEKLGLGELYNVEVSQNPGGQICSVDNGSGETGLTDIVDIDILCSSNTTSVTLSGSFTVAPFSQVDSDINNPFAPPNIGNSSFANAQSISNFSSVQGFSTKTATGRVAEGDRFASTTDVSDFYKVILQKDQTIQLQVVDFDGFTQNGIFEGDLDLFLYDSNFIFLAVSQSITEFESIIVPEDGEYYIQVLAFSGTSKYTLSLESVSPLVLSTHSSVDFKTGEAIVKFKPNTGIQAFKASNQLTSLSHGETDRATLASFEIIDNSIQSLSSQGGQQNFEQELALYNPEGYQKFNTLQQIKQLNLRSDVIYAEPNYIYHPLKVPNDEFYNFQWHYPLINLPQAWDITTGQGSENDVIVAVVDTGIFLNHPEFSGQLVTGYDFISDTTNAADGDGIDNNPDDPGDGAQINTSSWHGTHVAGTVAAKSDNNTGVAGIAWQAKIMPLRVLGTLGGSGYDIEQAIRFAAGLTNDSGTVPAQKADIINLSLGGTGFSQSSQDTYSAARNAGVIVIAAAGNNNSSQLFYPASYDGVVSVSATDLSNNRAPYSNFGVRVDVAAPGGDTGVDLNNDSYVDGVLSTLVDDSSGTRQPIYVFYQGTSMASPHMAGVTALMRSVHPDLSPDDLDNLLSSGAITSDLGEPGRDDVYGHGLIDALKAVQQAQILANGGTPLPLPAIIVATPSQITLGLSDSANITLSNEGGETASIISFSDDASWLSISESNVDANGLGEYLVSVDRTGLSDGSYSGSITFNLDTGSSLIIQVSMLVGTINSDGNVGNIFVRLLDSDNNNVQQVSPVDGGNGVFSYSFTDVDPGIYHIIGGSDIDNDQLICQLAEACGGYPTLDAQSDVEVINTDIDGLDFVIDILSNFGAGSLSD